MQMKAFLEYMPCEKYTDGVPEGTEVYVYKGIRPQGRDNVKRESVHVEVYLKREFALREGPVGVSTLRAKFPVLHYRAGRIPQHSSRGRIPSTAPSAAP